MRFPARILVAAAAGLATVGMVAAGAQAATISSPTSNPVGYTLTGPNNFVKITANLVFPDDATCGYLANFSPGGFGFQLSLGPGTLSVFTQTYPLAAPPCGKPEVQLTNAGNPVTLDTSNGQPLLPQPSDNMIFKLVFSAATGTIMATLTDTTQNNLVAKGHFTYSKQPGSAAAVMTFNQMSASPACLGKSCPYSPIFTNISVTDGTGMVGTLNGPWITTPNTFGGATPFMRNSGASFGVNLPGCPC